MKRERIYIDARQAVLEDGVDYVEFTRQGVVNLYNPQGLWQADEEHLTELLNDDEITRDWLINQMLDAYELINQMLDAYDDPGEILDTLNNQSFRHLCIMYAETYFNG